MNTNNWKSFKLGDLFKIKTGKYKYSAKTSEQGEISLVMASELNNGITQKVQEYPEDSDFLINEPVITISVTGKPCIPFFQDEPIYVSINVATCKLDNKFNVKLNKYIALFLCTIIKNEQFRFSYGRTLSNSRFNKTKIKLPATDDGTPDWDYMENYIKQMFNDTITDFYNEHKVSIN